MCDHWATHVRLAIIISCTNVLRSMIAPYALVKWGLLACLVIAERPAQVDRNPIYSHLRFCPVNNS